MEFIELQMTLDEYIESIKINKKKLTDEEVDEMVKEFWKKIRKRKERSEKKKGVRKNVYF